jgi:hypothetical protein
LNSLNLDQSLSCKTNKQRTASWLTGEAPTAFEEISQFSGDILSIYCNLLFTLIVFSLTLGIKITGVLSISILGSIILVSMLKNKIRQMTDEIQSSRLAVFIKIPKLWDNYFFGNKPMAVSNLKNFDTQAIQYFKETEKYTMLEQVVACLPIYIAVPCIMLVIFVDQQLLASIGALVAVLPRTLQLLGNVHAFSIFNSKFILTRRKYKNLQDFIKSLTRQDFINQINSTKVEIYNTESNISIPVSEFLDRIIGSVR